MKIKDTIKAIEGIQKNRKENECNQSVQGEGFTGGKWRVVNSGGMVTTERDNGYIIIATLETSPLRISREIEANARLIAEAKNMYNKLKWIVKDIEPSVLFDGNRSKWHEFYKESKEILNRINTK